MDFTFEEARAVAEKHLAANAESRHLDHYPDNPFSPPVPKTEFTLLLCETIETEWGWLFFAQPKAYVETGDLTVPHGTSSPIVLLKSSGQEYVAGTSPTVDNHLQDLSGWLGIRGPFSARGPDVEVRMSMVATEDGGRRSPTFSGYRPHFKLREDHVTSGHVELVEPDEIRPGANALARVTFLWPNARGSLWPGRVLDAQEGARVVARAEVVEVFNPILRAEQALYDILLGGEVIGRSALEGRDTEMGVAVGRFMPTFAFTKVAHVFALYAQSQGDTGTVSERLLDRYYAARDQLALRLRSPVGEPIETGAIHIADFRAEVGEDACEVEVHLRGSLDRADPA